jgi:hypothetical protein
MRLDKEVSEFLFWQSREKLFLWPRRRTMAVDRKGFLLGMFI